jgi:hypothetical protein
MKDTRNKTQKVSMYRQNLTNINPEWVQWLQTELDKALFTIKRLREERDTLETKIKNERMYWGQDASAIISNRDAQIKQLKDDNILLRLELKKRVQQMMPLKDWSQMKSADTELLPLGKGNLG